MMHYFGLGMFDQSWERKKKGGVIACSIFVGAFFNFEVNQILLAIWCVCVIFFEGRISIVSIHPLNVDRTFG